MKKIKKILWSENGMKVVNALFFLALLLPGSGVLFAAYLLWIVYLLFCIKNSESKTGKLVYGAFIAVATVMMGLNLYFGGRG